MKKKTKGIVIFLTINAGVANLRKYGKMKMYGKKDKRNSLFF